jgi:hypothetical protein
MKCITNDDPKKGKLTVRVRDEVAARLVRTGKWRYAPKKDWKAGGRQTAS